MPKSSVSPFGSMMQGAAPWLQMGLKRKWNKEDDLADEMLALGKEERGLGLGSDFNFPRRPGQESLSSGGSVPMGRDQRKRMIASKQKELADTRETNAKFDILSKGMTSLSKMGKNVARMASSNDLKVAAHAEEQYKFMSTKYKSIGIDITPQELKDKMSVQVAEVKALQGMINTIADKPKMSAINKARAKASELGMMYGMDAVQPQLEALNKMQQGFDKSKSGKLPTQASMKMQAFNNWRKVPGNEKKTMLDFNPIWQKSMGKGEKSQLSESKAVSDAEQRILSNQESPASRGPATVFNRYSNKPYAYVWKETPGKLYGTNTKMTRVDLPVLKGQQLTAKDIWFTANKNKKKYDDVLRDLGLIE